MTVENNTPFTQAEPVPQKKAQWPRLLLLFVAISLIGAWIFRALTPVQQPAQEIVLSNYDQSKTTFSKISYTGPSIDVPSSFPIGTGSLKTIDSNQTAEKIAAFFKLENKESINPKITINYESADYLLYFAPDNNSFSLSTKKGSPEVRLSDTRTALSNAQAMVDTIYGAGALMPQQSTIEYLAVVDGNHYENVDPDDATTILVKFVPSVGIYSVYLGQKLYEPVMIWVNGNLEIQKAYFYLEYPAISIQSQSPSLTYTQALKNIELGNASIITSTYDQAGFPSLASIIEGNLTSVSVKYRLDPASETVIPYYEFVGTLTNAQNQKINATIITPAIQTDFSVESE